MVPSHEPNRGARFDEFVADERTILPIRSAPAKQHPLKNQEIIFQSRIMSELIQQAKQFARSSAAVMITGETGTGKELFSYLIHKYSHRYNAPFVRINCAAMPEPLVERELFGKHLETFTGAAANQPGRLQLAHEGTVLLDEISQFSTRVQAKLLRAIEEQEIQPLGGNQIEPIDIRFIATSNCHLNQEMADNRFRSDLYYRLNTLQLEIPPLRERTEDIPVLVDHFIRIYRFESSHDLNGISDQALDLLCEYSWPGNVRELRNVIHRGCILSQSDQITVECLPPLSNEQEHDLSRTGSLADLERHTILTCLKKHAGNQTRAAQELGITPRTIRNKLKSWQQHEPNAA